MNRAEIIERLKKNLAQFQSMRSDECEVLRTIEKKNTQHLNVFGSWCLSCRTGDYSPVARYRICADYTEEPVEPHLDGYRLVEIHKPSDPFRPYTIVNNGGAIDIDLPVGLAMSHGAVDFWHPEHGIMERFVMRLRGEYVRATHVVFEEER